MAIEQLTTEKKEKTIVLSIVNHKGGVGKTTTVINLAHALVRLGETQNKDYRVLVVDSDPQANATSVLFPKGQDITQMPTLADVYDEREPFPHYTGYHANLGSWPGSDSFEYWPVRC